MHTVELLHDALEVAQRLNYGVRHGWLGTGGGACEVSGRSWIFVDLATNSSEQLDMVCEVLLNDARINCCELPGVLSRWLGIRRAA